MIMSTARLLVAFMVAVTAYAGTVSIEFVGSDASVSFSGLVPSGSNATVTVKETAKSKSTTHSDVSTSVLVIVSILFVLAALTAWNSYTKKRLRRSRVSSVSQAVKLPGNTDLRFVSVPCGPADAM